MDKNHILKSFFIITNKLKRLLDKKHNINGISSGQARLLSFLYHRSEKVIYQKDIEQEFQIRRGSVTGIVDTLEENGYVNRVVSEKDRRKNKIVLTKNGSDLAIKSIKTVQTLEKELSELLNKDEKQLFNKIMNKVSDWTDKVELYEKTV